MRHLIVIMSILLLSGCLTTGQPRIETEYQEVLTPISNVPMPPNTDCPPDALEVLDKAAPDGEVAKAYRIAVLQLRECSDLRQKVLDKYREIATQDAEKIEDITNPDGPFGSGAVTGENAGAPQVKLSPEEQRRQLVNESQLRNLGGEFDDLAEKKYDVGDLEI